MPKITDIKTINGKFGAFTVMKIDGSEYTLGKFAKMDGIVDGDDVTFEARASGDGKRSYINKITRTGGGATTSAAANTPTTPEVRVKRTETVPMSMLMSYAKDLITSGVVKVPVDGVDGVVDYIGTIAFALKTAHEKLVSGETDPT